MTPEEEYQLLMSRKALQSEVDSGGVVDESGEIPDSAGSQDVMKARQMEDAAAMQHGPDQKSGKLSAVGDTVTAGGAAGGNPYVAGAGLALKTVGMVDDAKRQSEQAKIDAYNKKIMAQRSAIRNIFA